MTIKTRKPGELVFNGVLVLISLFLVYQSYQISGIGKLSSPGFFPLLASAIMLVTSLSAFLSARKLTGYPHPVEGFLSQLLPKNVMIMLISALLFVLCLDSIGFITAALLFLLFNFSVFYRRSWLVALSLSLGTLVVIYVVFRVIFLVVLPENDTISSVLDSLGM